MSKPAPERRIKVGALLTLALGILSIASISYVRTPVAAALNGPSAGVTIGMHTDTAPIINSVWVTQSPYCQSWSWGNSPDDRLCNRDFRVWIDVRQSSGEKFAITSLVDVHWKRVADVGADDGPGYALGTYWYGDNRSQTYFGLSMSFPENQLPVAELYRVDATANGETTTDYFLLTYSANTPGIEINQSTSISSSPTSSEYSRLSSRSVSSSSKRPSRSRFYRPSSRAPRSSSSRTQHSQKPAVTKIQRAVFSSDYDTAVVRFSSPLSEDKALDYEIFHNDGSLAPVRYGSVKVQKGTTQFTAGSSFGGFIYNFNQAGGPGSYVVVFALCPAGYGTPAVTRTGCGRAYTAIVNFKTPQSLSSQPSAHAFDLEASCTSSGLVISSVIDTGVLIKQFFCTQEAMLVSCLSGTVRTEGNTYSCMTSFGKYVQIILH